MEIGDRIREARKGRSWTQKHLASLLGVTVQAVSQWENSQTKPDFARANKIANALGVPRDWILEGKNFTSEEIIKRNNDWIDIPVYEFSYIIDENALVPVAIHRDSDRGDISAIKKALPKPNSYTLGSHFYSSNAFAIIIDREDQPSPYLINDLIIVDSSVVPQDGDIVITWEPSPGKVMVALQSYDQVHALEPDQDPASLFRHGAGRIVMLLGTVVELRRYRSMSTSSDA